MRRLSLYMRVIAPEERSAARSCAASTVPLPPLSTIMKIARLSGSEHCT